MGYSAEDEQRTFLIDYTVEGVVRHYEDVAEFYWKVIEDQHEPIGRIGVRVWYVGATGMPSGSLASLSRGLAGFDAFAANMSSMMSSFSTALASGGGFSGRGGGGGGSSGAG